MSDTASAPEGLRSCGSVSEDDARRQTGEHGGKTVDTRGPQHDVHPPDCAQFAGDAFIFSGTVGFKKNNHIFILVPLFVLLAPPVCPMAGGVR